MKILYLRFITILFDNYDLNYQYLMYHGWSFGIYTNHGNYPSPSYANQPLIDLFKSHIVTSVQYANPVNTIFLNIKIISTDKKNYTIAYIIGEPSIVSISIYDILGRKIINIAKSNKQAGIHELNIPGTNIHGGLYFLRINTSCCGTATYNFINENL